MPLERVMMAAERQGEPRLSRGWRDALVGIAIVWAALTLLGWREWQEMAHQWWNIDTYAHILVVPAILVWLVALRWPQIARLDPQPWFGGVAALALALAVWALGRISAINLIAHLGAVMALSAAALAILGPRIGAMLMVPMGYSLFLVPFGDEIIAPLQSITARIAVWLTELSGISARIDGYHIDTPAGLFIVAEACSGVKFLIAMVALGALLCATAFESWRRRAAVMAACVIVPILANGVRAWATIYVAQIYGAQVAGGFDHIVYGWIFFALVVALVIAIALPFAEREPDAMGPSIAQVERWLAQFGLAPRCASLRAVAASIGTLALGFAFLVFYLGRALS